MKEIKLPQGYKPLLSIYETQRAIDLEIGRAHV